MESSEDTKVNKKKTQDAKPSEPSLKVLIADDDIPTRMLLRAAISQWGYEVVEARDGEEAWDLLQQGNAPRLVILDWLMPKLDGVTLCSRSRKELKFHPYIILLTQVTGITNLIKGLEAGADEFLSKPFNMAELKSRLSIGARIIKNENEIAMQKNELQLYISGMQGLIASTKQMTKELNDNIMQSTDAKKTEYLRKAEKLQENLHEIQEIFDRLEVEAKKRT